tara:strand:+ start:90 stop:248 length:159 start_codon:yes stop_codon:yes gene_type:complete
MGRGDKKSKKGKRFKGSYGVSRPKKTDTVAIPSKAKKSTAKEKTKKKTSKKK